MSLFYPKPLALRLRQKRNCLHLLQCLAAVYSKPMSLGR